MPSPRTINRLQRRTIALGLVVAIVVAVTGIGGTAFAGPGPTVCRQQTVAPVTVTIIVASNATAACAGAPAAERLEDCLFQMAAGTKVLTKEQLESCFPTIDDSEGIDDPLGLLGDRGAGGDRGRGDVTSMAGGGPACADAPPDPGSGISADPGPRQAPAPPRVDPGNASVSASGTLDVDGRKVVVEATVKVGPLSLPDPLAPVKEALASKPTEGTTSADAENKANQAVDQMRTQITATPTTEKPPTSAPPTTEKPPTSTPPSSTPPTTTQAGTSRPVGPDGDGGTGLDTGLPCQVEAIACSPRGRRSAPALCADPPDLTGKGACDPTVALTTEGAACTRAELTVEELEAGLAKAQLRCSAVAHPVPGVDPCAGPQVDGSPQEAMAEQRLECRSVVHTDPDAGGGTSSDPCAPGGGLRTSTPTTMGPSPVAGPIGGSASSGAPMGDPTSGSVPRPGFPMP